MLRTPFFVALPATLVLSVLAGSAGAQNGAGTVSSITFPGGLRAAASVVHDPLAPDRSQFLAEFIRRTYGAPIARNSDRALTLRSLLAHLAAAGPAAPDGTVDTVPLPLPPTVWTTVIFGGRVSEQGLLPAILGSRDASLFYCALLSLDDDTRRWIASEPALVKELASASAAAFLVAAPGVRVAQGRVGVPGGDMARPAWEAIVGHPVTEPVSFVRALVTEHEGRRGYVLSSMAQLSPADASLAFSLGAQAVEDRIAAARRLALVFDRVTRRWNVGEQPFSRPLLDPALLVSSLARTERGGPHLPGSAPFWRAVFAGGDVDRVSPEAPAGEARPVEFASLADQVFTEMPEETRVRFQAVLFASRLLRALDSSNLRDALVAVRAALMYPALVSALERARIADISVYAGAARRARGLSAIGNHERAARALAQFQGLVAIVTRAAGQGSFDADHAARMVSSLSAVEVDPRGDYGGAMVRWVIAQVRPRPDVTASNGNAGIGADGDDINESAAAPVEREFLHLLAGPRVTDAALVEWEGTTYRVDYTRAEATRLMRVLGDTTRPYLSTAIALVEAADRSHGAPGRDDVQACVAALDHLWAMSEPEDGDTPAAYRKLVAGLERAARTGDMPAARDAVPEMLLAADDLLARGIMDLVYATALGQPDRGAIRAADAARRHDFGLRAHAGYGVGAWRNGWTDAEGTREWHVTGSLLNLDVVLADFWLTRVSLKPRSAKPTLEESDRRVFIEAVALMQPRLLTDADRDALLVALGKGRDRVAGLHTWPEALVAADAIGLAPDRRTLFAWTVSTDPSHAAAFLSPAELLSLGTESLSAFDAWGVPAGPRLGCLCLRMPSAGPWQNGSGRWYAGMLASAFPDLNLRLAQLLAELRMPAPLLAAVLASATLDFVDTATSRDSDDRRALVEYVNALGLERVEEYLALLTTGGPLVPTGDPRQPRPSD